MAEPGLYLSSFVENFLRSRGLEEQRGRAEAQEAGEIFKVQRYLDDLGRERKAGMSAAQRLQGYTSPQDSGVIPSTPPTWRGGASAYEGPPNPEAPPIPSVAAGGAAAMQHGLTAEGMAPRPPALASALQGLSTEDVANLFTTQTGRAAFQTLEAAEQHRRKEKNHKKAEELWAEGRDAFRRNEPAEALGLWAAAYRHIEDQAHAGRLMEMEAKIRTDPVEKEKTKKDFAAFNTVLDAYDLDPSPQNLSNVQKTFADAESLAGRERASEMMKARIKGSLDPDRDINAFLVYVSQRAIGPNRVPVEQAWDEAMDKYPKAFGKLWLQDILNPEKPILPDHVREKLRLPPRGPDKRDQTITQRAYFDARAEAQRLGVVVSYDNPKFMRIWEDKINEREGAKKQAGKTPGEREKEKVDLETAKDRAAITKMRRTAMENPASLEGKTSNELTIEIQRTARDLDKIDDPEIRSETERYLTLLRRALTAKGGPKADVAPQDKKAQAEQIMNRLFPGKTWDQLNAKQKKQVADQVK